MKTSSRDIHISSHQGHGTTALSWNFIFLTYCPWHNPVNVIICFSDDTAMTFPPEASDKLAHKEPGSLKRLIPAEAEAPLQKAEDQAALTTHIQRSLVQYISTPTLKHATVPCPLFIFLKATALLQFRAETPKNEHPQK